MNLIELVLMIAATGFVVWIIQQIPMSNVFKNIIVGVVAFALIVWLLQTFGLITGIKGLRLR